MKQQFKTWGIAALLGLISLAAFSQEPDSAIPRWVSGKGYWIVESNINTPLRHTIRFYNNDHVLLYRENLEGVKLDPAKRKVKMKLKKVLEAAVLAWEKKKVPEENKDYVMAILK